MTGGGGIGALSSVLRSVIGYDPQGFPAPAENWEIDGKRALLLAAATLERFFPVVVRCPELYFRSLTRCFGQRQPRKLPRALRLSDGVNA
jgi:hypothetical protein